MITKRRNEIWGRLTGPTTATNHERPLKPDPGAEKRRQAIEQAVHTFMRRGRRSAG